MLRFSSRHIDVLILLTCVFFSLKYQMADNNLEKVIKSDGLGYYSYLPAVFIFGDYTYSFTEEVTEKYPKTDFGDGFLKASEGGKVNKYYVGLAILWVPFFLLAHVLALIFGWSADGYSVVYHISVMAAANFYLWLGCRYTRKLLLQYAVPEYVAALVLVAVVFGTNLFFYATFDASHSHVYSFAMIAGFLYFCEAFFRRNALPDIYRAAILLGLITLLRPTNAVIALMALFFAGSMGAFWRQIAEHRIRILAAAGIFVLTLFPQFLLYYLQSGAFIVWSYGDEKFYFGNPHLTEILFSYRKGHFVYTPMVLLSVFGFIYLFKTDKFRFFILLLTVSAATYIIASWWCWWYGASLGQRAFVDYYALLALLLAFAFFLLRTTPLKIAFFAAAGVFTFYSLTLSYQYRNRIIDTVHMNKQKFWFTFLKTDRDITGLAFFDPLFEGIETADIVNIAASDGMFLCADGDGEKHILANKESASLWETFNRVTLNEETVALKSYTGYFVTADPAQGHVLRYTAVEAGEREFFELHAAEDDSFYIKAFNGKYLVRKGEFLKATGEHASEAERFRLIEK